MRKKLKQLKAFLGLKHLIFDLAFDNPKELVDNKPLQKLLKSSNVNSLSFSAGKDAASFFLSQLLLSEELPRPVKDMYASLVETFTDVREIRVSLGDAILYVKAKGLDIFSGFLPTIQDMKDAVAKREKQTEEEERKSNELSNELQTEGPNEFGFLHEANSSACDLDVNSNGTKVTNLNTNSDAVLCIANARFSQDTSEDKNRYYEVKVLSIPPTGEVHVGMLDETERSSYPEGSQTGTGKGSYGYSSADGKISSQSWEPSAAKDGEVYGVDDVIGCGLTSFNRVYFTKNGKFIGFGDRQGDNPNWLPLVSTTKGSSILLILPRNIAAGAEAFSFDFTNIPADPNSS